MSVGLLLPLVEAEAAGAHSGCPRSGWPHWSTGTPCRPSSRPPTRPCRWWRCPGPWPESSGRRASTIPAAAAGVVDKDLLVGVHHPHLVARRRARRPARGGVAGVERIRFGQLGVQPVLERLVRRRVVHHVELRGLRVAEVESRHLLALGERYDVRAIATGKCLGKPWLDDFATVYAPASSPVNE